MMEKMDWLLPYLWKEEKWLLYQRNKGATEIDGETLQKWLKTEPEPEEIWDMAAAYLDIQETIEQHLLDEEKILWDPAWIWWDEKRKSLKLIYVPFDGFHNEKMPFLQELVKALWTACIGLEWKKEAAVYALYRLNTASEKCSAEWGKWRKWVENERLQLEDGKEKEKALEILTEKEEGHKKGSWFRRWKEKMPITFR